MNLLTDLRAFFFPRFCLSCGRKLQPYESAMCTSCWYHLPFTHLSPTLDNEMVRCFWGRFPIQKAVSGFYYAKGGEVARLLHEMKYHGARVLCRQMGEKVAQEYLSTGFFDGIDVLLPVPLAPARLAQRGYNQSELLARGVSSVTGIPVYTEAVVRVRNNATQTHESAYGRWSNVQGLFAATPQGEELRHKHVLLIDDVLTTGATLVACADALSEIEDISFSVLTLAWAK